MERFFYFYPMMMAAIEDIYEIYLRSSGVNTDTRSVSNNQFFFALKGDNFNGNAFANKAIEAGALMAVIDEKEFYIEGKTCLVDNVLKTLQDMAAYHRQQLDCPIIALTGSNGKTTTKELINTVLASSYSTLCTVGNLNNHIGIPLTLLNIKKTHEIAIIEMGANHLGEIASYCEWIQPSIGIITNIGKAHLEGFGGEDGVRQGKTELYRYIQKNGGELWVNQDDDLLVQNSENIPRNFYGKNNEYFHVTSIDESQEYLCFDLEYQSTSYRINSKLSGVYNLSNIILAMYAGLFFKIPIEKIIFQIENYIPTNSRSQIIKKEDYTIILDAYNANPSSMLVAIKNVSSFEPNTIACLGAMKELGEATEKEHLAIGELLKKLNIHEVILIGEEFRSTALLYQYPFFTTSMEAKTYFYAMNKKGKTILIKGSRGSAMEKIL